MADVENREPTQRSGQLSGFRGRHSFGGPSKPDPSVAPLRPLPSPARQLDLDVGAHAGLAFGERDYFELDDVAALFLAHIHHAAGEHNRAAGYVGAAEGGTHADDAAFRAGPVAHVLGKPGELEVT